MDVNGQRGLSEASTPTSSGVLGKSNKIDPYLLITQVCIASACIQGLSA